MIQTKNGQLRKANVVGISEEDNGIIYYLVTEKKDLSDLDKGDVISETVLVSPIKRKRTKVIEIGEVFALVDSKRYRPLIGGCEIQPKGTNWVGTLGALCEGWLIGNIRDPDIKDYISLFEKYDIYHLIKHKRYGLTNAHVASISIENPKLNEEILQPNSGKKVGDTSEVIPIKDGVMNEIDAALIELITEMSSAQLGGIGTPKGLTLPSRGLKIKKYGRTTRYKEGEILATNAQTSIRYSSGLKDFKHLIVASRFSGPGDSGSLVVSDGGMIIGLIFAGSDKTSLIIPINSIIENFKGIGVVLDG